MSFQHYAIFSNGVVGAGLRSGLRFRWADIGPKWVRLKESPDAPRSRKMRRDIWDSLQTAPYAGEPVGDILEVLRPSAPVACPIPERRKT